MKTVSATIRIDTPPEKVWAALTTWPPTRAWGVPRGCYPA